MKNKITEKSLLELTLKIPVVQEQLKLARLYLDMWNIFKCAYKNGDDVFHSLIFWRKLKNILDLNSENCKDV